MDTEYYILRGTKFIANIEIIIPKIPTLIPIIIYSPYPLHCADLIPFGGVGFLLSFLPLG